MKTGTIYETATGRIEMTVVAPDEAGIELQIRDRQGFSILFDQLVDGNEYYIENGAPVARPELTNILSGDVYIGVNEVLRINQIPAGSRVIYPGGVTIVEDGFIEWSTVEAGVYHFKVLKFPYKEVSINAIVG